MKPKDRLTDGTQIASEGRQRQLLEEKREKIEEEREERRRERREVKS